MVNSSSFGSRFGIAVLKTSLDNTYQIQVLDKTYDVILLVIFKDKQTDFSFVVFSLYLQPEGYVHADATHFFAHVLSQLYLYQHVDLMFILEWENWNIV